MTRLYERVPRSSGVQGVLGDGHATVFMDRSLSQDLADAWRALVVSAIYDAEQDTPVNRLILAELALERATAPPSPPL